MTTGYFGFEYVRFKDRSMYHRSRMFEYELMANLYKVFPVGTPIETFLAGLKLDRSEILSSPAQNTIYVDIFPELPIPKEEQRDYSGFNVYFKEGKLFKISPVGPDMARNKINLTDLPIGKEIKYNQKP